MNRARPMAARLTRRSVDLKTALLKTHDEAGLVRNRLYFCRRVVAINAKVIHRFGVSDISLYILCIAWV